MISANAYITSVNLMRRVLNTGQQAMTLAMMYPEPEKGGRGKKKTVDETSIVFSAKRLQLGRVVLHHSRSLADSVLKGITPLDAALAQVKQEQQFQSSDEANAGKTAPATGSGDRS